MDQNQTFTSVSDVFTKTIGNESENFYFTSLLFTYYFSEDDFQLEQEGASFTVIENENSGIFTIDYLGSLGQGQLTIAGEEQENSVFFDANFNFRGIDSSTIDGNLRIEGQQQGDNISFNANYLLNENGSLSEQGSLEFTAGESNGNAFFDLNIKGSDEEGQEETKASFRGTVDKDNDLLAGSLTSETIVNGDSQGSETTAFSFPVPDEIFTTSDPNTDPNPDPILDPLDININRFQNSDVPGTYLFAGEEESASIRDNFPNFVEEGLAFKVSLEPADDLIPLYRFQSLILPGTYLFAGEEERISIKENFSDSFVEEGLAFYVYGAGTGKGREFTRFQNSDIPGTYLFAGEEESESIRNNFPSFIEEGAAFEVAI